jgi:hypothetical protein
LSGSAAVVFDRSSWNTATVANRSGRTAHFAPSSRFSNFSGSSVSATLLSVVNWSPDCGRKLVE